MRGVMLAVAAGYMLVATGCTTVVKMTAFKPVPQMPDRVALTIEDRTVDRMTPKQRSVLNEILREGLEDGGIAVVPAGQAGAPSLVGQITTYDPGSRLIRYCISFGAGKGHFASSWVLKDDAGAEVGTGAISGFIRAGIFGGSYKTLLKKSTEELVRFLNGADR